ncbi:hypothetical protein B5M09_002641 [Aphanomyces astaci]|uniref:Uncharacterized protein n=1 Tax=Aphanomyces astaci TaxID=112090 RepID=A0A425CSU2_APHAT|nr:hypothetical protein B5M09_002641 [Aphanomyces astaci]
MYTAKPKTTLKAKQAQDAAKVKVKKGPSVEECVARRDFTGAATILEFNVKSDDTKVEDKRMHLLWLAYCYFHLGHYQRALDTYEEVRDPPEDVFLFRACCMYYLQLYKEATKEALKGPSSNPLQNRILFHCAHKLGDEDKLLVYHQKLSQCKEDQLSLAAIHYLRNHFQEATDIYKRLLLENRDDIALNVYVAMCYYKLDYYDVSLEIMQTYLQAFPDSVIAINVKACNQFKLYNGNAAKDELRALTDKGYNIENNDLVNHNMVVFDDGQNALRTLPQVVDSFSEARLNLVEYCLRDASVVIYYLKHGKVQEAFDLIKDIEPSTPQEYILKGVVHATLGQQTNSRQHIKTAQQYFQLVGSSPTECDTIPGRQCMASCFYLLKQFEDVNIYLNSVKQYMYNEDDFNWNFGVSLCNTGSHAEALETLLRVQCKRGACVGVFQKVVAGKASHVELEEVFGMLKTNNNPQVEYIVRIMKKWCTENGISL